MWSLRFHGNLCFSRIGVQLLRIWQPRDRTISVRWSFSGDPRVLHSLGAAEVRRSRARRRTTPPAPPPALPPRPLRRTAARRTSPPSNFPAWWGWLAL